MKELNDKMLFTTSEIAKILGVSRITVFNRIKSGAIKADKIGRDYLISKEEISNLLDKTLNDEEKKEIDERINIIIEEYKDALKMLGRE